MIIHGDCLAVLPTLDDNLVDAIVTDPPYELGFMNKGWDASGIAYNVDLWRECLRVLKPGGHLLSFGGSRTYHRMACAIEDAGFEIRDQIQWIYGSGFPKSQNIGKAIDKAAGVEREVIGRHENAEEIMRRSRGGSEKHNGWERPWRSNPDVVFARGNITAPATPEAMQWEGWGSALKPAHEPIVLARKPLSEKTIATNVLKWGTGGINIDGCRVETNGDISNYRKGHFSGDVTKSQDPSSFNTNKPLTPPHPQGRFPANLIHDGSDEVVQGFPQANGAVSNGRTGGVNGYDGGWGKQDQLQGYSDSGSAARFFYCAKASKAERNMGLTDKAEVTVNDGRQKDIDNPYQRGITPRKNSHPTVKPLALMRYLCRLITPPDGTVLDPFAGSGSTLIAAKQEGFNYIGIELEAEYIEIAKCRLSAVGERQPSLFEG